MKRAARTERLKDEDLLEGLIEEQRDANKDAFRNPQRNAVYAGFLLLNVFAASLAGRLNYFSNELPFRTAAAGAVRLSILITRVHTT